MKRLYIGVSIIIFMVIVSYLIYVQAIKADEKMNINEGVVVDLSAVEMIYDLFQNMKEGKSLTTISNELDSILDSRPYQTMFQHYNRSWRPNHLPKDVFKRMILSLQFPDQYTPGENRRSGQMLPKWKTYYNNLSMFEDKLEHIKGMNLNRIINESIKRAENWLPPEMKIENYYFFIHPNGGSLAFVIFQAQGYDFFQFETNEEKLSDIVAHESHHIGLNIPEPEFKKETDSLAFEFLTIFVGEGTATKFIDNAPGGYTPQVNNKKSSNIPLSTWRKYTLSEEKIFQRMIDTFNKLHSGEMSKDELDLEIENYWVKGIKGRNYFIGSEIFGAIYHALGKDGVFTAIRDPRKMFELYNKAIEKESNLLTKCPKIPEITVKNAVSLGE